MGVGACPFTELVTDLAWHINKFYYLLFIMTVEA